MTAFVYEVDILGDVTDHTLAQLRAQLGDVAAVHQPASTLITGTVPDQAALVGVLDNLHALGLEVRELRRVVDGEAHAKPQPASTAIMPRPGP